jgi:hypothetical protein
VFDIPTAEELYSNLKMTEEGNLEVVKRSGRDESIQVVIIHLCMEAMLGISLYS